MERIEAPDLHPESILEADDLENTADLLGEDIPSSSDYLSTRQKDGRVLGRMLCSKKHGSG